MTSTALVKQSPFIADVFAENPEPRCPCVLVLDTSGSMEGRPLTQLNAGYQTLLTELLEDALASKRVELAVVTFGPVKLVQDFETPDMIAASDLEITGEQWIYDHGAKKVSIARNTRITFKAQLPDLLK